MMRISSSILLLALLTACVTPPVPGELQAEEIKEYEGEKLGSVGDFRENSIQGVQRIDITDYYLRIDGLVNNPVDLTYDEVISKPNYNKLVTLHCVEGWDVKALWTGVLVSDLVDDVGVQDSANTVKFYAVDGYTTTLPLNYIQDNQIILAHKINNVTLPPAQGYPFILVAESKWGYKWIRWVNRIELTDNPEEKGFWEQRGYNQEGNISGHIFER